MNLKHILPTALTALLFFTATLKAEHTRVYFGTSNSRGIYTSELDSESGSLAPLTLAAKIGSPGFIAIHPNQQFLYATTSGFETPNNAGVAAFKIQADGTLELINKLPSGGSGACHLSIDPTGQSLVVVHYSSGSTASFQILPDGALAATESLHAHSGSGEHPKRQNKPHPHSAFIHPYNQFVYVPDLGIDQIIIYQLSPELGTLTPIGSADVPGGSQGPRHMKFSPDGTHAYVLNELSLTVATYAVDLATGELLYLDSQSVFTDSKTPDQMTCAEIRLHPNGRFVYTSARDLNETDRDTLSTFQRASDGTLELIDNTPANVSIPRNFNIDPTGRWLIAGGQNSSTLTIFSINPDTGELNLKQSDIPFDGGPICIEFIK